MTEIIRAIRGMNDILPAQTSVWQQVETTIAHVLQSYGYQQIRPPLLERTELFSRSIGEVTDIVEKEMYTFSDRNDESITLRPEGTAGCVRAGIEHDLFYGHIQRLWYTGPMFRYEKPQKERYRQFYQIGGEVYGLSGPDIDAEIILMTARFWQRLGLNNLELHINSLGSAESRAIYRESLVNYFKQQHDKLDADSQRRLHTNPLRILDSKNPQMQTLIQEAPQMLDYLDSESRQHFDELSVLLQQMGLNFRINPHLVRGLDYYNRTVFEWITQQLGSQGTVCAGGRYDGLVEQLGGRSVPAIGFAIGIERLVALWQQQVTPLDNHPDAYLVMVGKEALPQGLKLAEFLRDTMPDLRLLMHCGGGNFKAQFKRADKSQARLALVLGEDEITQQQVTIKFLREEKEQVRIARNELVEYLTQTFKN